MKHKTPNVNPQISRHIWHAIYEEWLAIQSLLKFQWPVVALFIIGVTIFIYVVRPLPPLHLKLATGQPDSSLELLGKKYVDYFQKNGIKLELINTAGAFENINLLKQGKVDAAFSVGGIITDIDSSNIVSLGSVEYQPFWMFYRGPEYDGTSPSKFFDGKIFSINIPGSGTRNLTEKILSMHEINIENNKKLISMSSADSVEALLAGKIDGVFLVAGIESKTIKKIVAHPEIKVFNFSVADAYAKRLKFLEVLSLPRGSLDLIRVIPHQNTQLVATTTTILANPNLHPAIQHLFLNGARKIDDIGQGFFSRTGGFPALIERGIPASTVAERYYSKGPPTLNGYVPFWLASFFDQIWFVLFAIFAIGYPLTKIFPNYRIIYAKLCISDCFDELIKVDVDMIDPSTLDELQIKLDRFDVIEKKVNKLWVPAGLRDDFYNLKNAVEIVRLKTERLKESLKA